MPHGLFEIALVASRYNIVPCLLWNEKGGIGGKFPLELHLVDNLEHQLVARLNTFADTLTGETAYPCVPVAQRTVARLLIF